MNPARLSLLVLLTACASEAPEIDRATASFDASAGEVTVTVLGDGFVRSGERRVPLEAFVLELRQHTRNMPPEALQRFVVHVLAAPQVAGSAAAQVTRRDIDRLIDQLYIMGVAQVRLL